MPRPQKPVPDYLLHKPSGLAYCRVPRPGGARRPVYLGRYGSPESKREYQRILAELEVAQPSEPMAGVRVSVNVLIDKFLTWAEKHYRRGDGSITNELDEIKRSVTPLAELYGSLPAADFGPLALKAVRNRMLKAGWCRTLINKRVARVRRAFKWAVAEELLPVEVHTALVAVPGLQRLRCTARESEPVGPVPPGAVEAVKPFLTPEIRTMIEVQQLAAMRPQDVCNLKLGDIDRSGDVWIFRPSQHKGEWRGKVRVVMIGPKAQALLVPFLDGLAPGDHVFSPARAVAASRARRRAARVTKVQPSQADRSKTAPKRKPGDRYSGRAYAHAIAKACAKAGIPSWGPNRLRHSAATDIRQRFGLEAAQAALGHEKADVTQIYAERNHKLAATVAKEMG